jgi:hypothetical protein
MAGAVAGVVVIADPYAHRMDVAIRFRLYSAFVLLVFVVVAGLAAAIDPRMATAGSSGDRVDRQSSPVSSGKRTSPP